VAVEAFAELVAELSGRPEIESIRYDASLAEPPTTAAMGAPERWNIDAVHALRSGSSGGPGRVSWWRRSIPESISSTRTSLRPGAAGAGR
jgi:hypothetical protein